MAKVSITVGAITVERVVDDATASNVLNLYYAATYRYQEGDPANPTPRQRLQTVLNAVVSHITGTAQEYRRRELRSANEVMEQQEVGGISL